MKHILAVFLVFSFLSSTLGIQVYKHYCGVLLEDVGFYLPPDSCADEGGEEMCSSNKETSCCDDELEIHQLKIDFRKTQEQELKKATPTLIAIFNLELLEEQELMKQEGLNFVFYLPDIPIYKRLKRLTLYA